MFLDYILRFTQMAGLFSGRGGAWEGTGVSALKPMYCNDFDFVCLKLIKAIASGWPRANKRQNASSCIDLDPSFSPHPLMVNFYGHSRLSVDIVH